MDSERRLLAVFHHWSLSNMFAGTYVQPDPTPLPHPSQVKAITLTNQDLKPLSGNRQWIKKASASNILTDPENPYVAMPVDTTIPDEPDPLEHIYDIIPPRAPEATCVRTASFGSPQELAFRMQEQQQQQQQQQPVYDVPGRRVRCMFNGRVAVSSTTDSHSTVCIRHCCSYGVVLWWPQWS